MDVRDWLKRATDNGKKRVRQIVFEGERLEVMSCVRVWRSEHVGSAARKPTGLNRRVNVF